jgi:hypothetical protein
MSVLETLADLTCVKSRKVAQTIISELEARGLEITPSPPGMVVLAKAGCDGRTPEQKQAHGNPQRAGWVRGEMELARQDGAYWPALDP